MRAEMVTINPDHPDPGDVKRAGEILKKGGLVAFPTETVYGLGGNALDPSASEKYMPQKGGLRTTR